MKSAVLSIFCCCAMAAATLKPATFSARRDYKTIGSVQTADINGDGIPDIVVMDGSVNTWLGNGNGTFRAGPGTGTGWFAVSWQFALADVNGDGKIDLIIAGGMSSGEHMPGGIGICFGNGDGTFQSPVLYPTGQEEPNSVAVGDFNGDGIPDVATTGPSGLWLFTGAGGGLFNPGSLTPDSNLAGPIIAANLNGDGSLDLVCQAYGGFAVVFGNGNGTFQAPIAYTASGRYIATGDFTRNGRTDIAIGGGSSPGVVNIFLNNGRGVFFLSGTVTTSGFPFAVGDVNGDGIPDVVDSAVCVALGQGGLKFAPDVCYPVPGDGDASYNMVLADLQKNGVLDVVVGQLVTSVLLNEGNGQLADGLWIPLAGAANCAAAADYNGDGKPDLAVATTDGVTILLGTGNASAPYTKGATISVAGGIGCPVSGDLNDDGVPDLVFGSNNAGGIVAYLGNGDGTFTQAGTVAFSPGFFVLGDFNNDGRLDIAGSSNQLAWGKGNGNFEDPVTLVADAPFGGFTWAAKGDLNNDGWLDLVLTATEANELYVLMNNHHGGFTVGKVRAGYNEGSGPFSVMLADLNRDGNLDAVVQMYYGYSVAVYLGNGQGGFKLTSQTFLQYVGSYPQPPQVGDVNGDHIPDILMPASGSLAINLGKGDGSFLTQPYIGTGNGAGQIILTNVHGQPPAAGVPDIVSPDNTGGVLVLINTTQQ